METNLSFIEKIKLRREFKKETDMYCMEPLFGTTYCWNEVGDIPDMGKSKTIYFEQLKEKQFLVTLYNCEGKSYWKLYIVDNKKVQQVVYLESRMMNPVKKKEQ